MIRQETTKDSSAISRIHEQAFGGTGEASLVERLRERGADTISLVYEQDGVVHGHILFSPMKLDDSPAFNILGLAPVAVAPDHQNRGIGSALINAGVEEAKKIGVQAIAVLGHAEYYPKFGFVPSDRYGIKCEYDVPKENFMVLELEKGYLGDFSGVVHYHSAFGELQ